jgi:hypothetical protein
MEPKLNFPKRALILNERPHHEVENVRKKD